MIKQKLDFDCYDEDFDFNLCDLSQIRLIPSVVCGGVLLSPFLAVECEEILTTKPNWIFVKFRFCSNFPQLKYFTSLIRFGYFTNQSNLLFSDLGS
ncbi:hypothetical protein L1987_80942 [Smallanthus sonchifolius]|uniref:Uncharacterized protein n=1 Tax=Smallanthus sonchifolius TaxID=185202 RepID=A0ACB8YPN2_9ASTR|nr:hypothetical protein L1987_80942 [Smallanthus sonchifolius]